MANNHCNMLKNNKNSPQEAIQQTMMVDTSKTWAQKEAAFKGEDVDASLRKLLFNDDEEDLYRDEEMAEKV